ncbi:hypothetical protein FACS1894147_01630 [Spirochaetia bacterium]|nr:hypothetical protein FACS1894147_01630 [Spirochaetia bacterium]
MKRNDCFMPAGRTAWAAGVLVMALTLGLALAGCASGPKKSSTAKAPVALSPKLEESLRKYMGPVPQTWGGDNDRFDVDVYFLDPLRFDAFKAELEALGEYQQDGGRTFTRDWDRGTAFARLGVRTDGRLEMALAKANNSTSEYRYTKKPEVSGENLPELLRKYIAPRPEMRGDGADAEEIAAYFLDPLRFEAFKAELDAEDEYMQFWSRNDIRDWDLGKASVKLAVRPNGSFELELCREDNSRSNYRYGKVFQAASGSSPVTLGPQLAESLRKYMGGSQPEKWDDEEVTLYYLDPSRFKAFQTELDALGEYQQTGGGYDDNRDWDQGKTFARLVVRSDGRLELDLCQADNSKFNSQYTKNPQASGEKLAELLSKYAAPREITWDDGSAGTVYSLDPSRFEALRAEIRAGGEYIQGESWTNDNRDWNLGKSWARLGAEPNGKFFMELGREDNSFVLYRYKAYSGPLKTVKINGYRSSQSITTVYSLALFLEAPAPEDDHHSSAKAGIDINGQTITCTLLNDEDWRDNPVPFTGTGKFYIQLHVAPAKNDKSLSGARYFYSADGKTPTAVDITNDTTTLDWTKFIWFEDVGWG